MTKDEVLSLVVTAAVEKNARNLVVLDVVGLTSLTDYVVILTAPTYRHLKTWAAYLCQEVKKAGQEQVYLEGDHQGGWLLVDANDVIVHLFTEDSRRYYAIEELWQQARSIDVYDHIAFDVRYKLPKS